MTGEALPLMEAALPFGIETPSFTATLGPSALGLRVCEVALGVVADVGVDGAGD